MKRLILKRILFEKILIKDPSCFEIWISYIFFEIKRKCIKHAEKILFRAFFCLKEKTMIFVKMFFFQNQFRKNFFGRKFFSFFFHFFQTSFFRRYFSTDESAETETE